MRRWLSRLHAEYGHPTAPSLARTVLQEYDWEERVADIEFITSSCDSCERGELIPPPRAKLVGKRANWKLGDEWSIDLLSDLPKTARGFTQLLIAVEAVSRFAEIYPLKARGSKEVAGCLLDLFLRYGAPRRLRCDQGSEFEGHVKIICEHWGVQLEVISSHHPQSAGQVELFNRNVMDRLTRESDGNIDWDLQCMLALHGLRCAPSRRLRGMSPHQVVFGEPPRVNYVLEDNMDSKIDQYQEEWTE